MILNYLMIVVVVFNAFCVRDSNAAILKDDIPVLNGYAPLP
jgi:hypothetical protein